MSILTSQCSCYNIVMELVTSYSKLSIKHIFQEHWDDYLSKNKDSIPQHVIDTVEKMLACRNPNKLGYHKYRCPDHPEISVTVPHSCKCGFCTTCGKILTDKFVDKINSAFPYATFHHICFTIPQSLRGLFNNYRFLLNCMFRASSQTILSWSNERHFLPAIICTIHTFGKRLNFNVHLHILVTAGGLALNSETPKWRNCPHFPFNMLRKRWQYLLITELKESIQSYLKNNPDCGELSVFSRPGAFSAYFNPLFDMEWYVWESDELEPQDFTVSYVVRYTKRPPLAECRLHRYYNENEEYFVTFSYKERNYSPILWSLPVENFISLLIQHILDKGFKKVRYYGLLANRVRTYYLDIIAKLHKRMKRTITFFAWRRRQILFTGKDPLKCPICERTMQLVEIAYFSKKLNGLAYYYPP